MERVRGFEKKLFSYNKLIIRATFITMSKSELQREPCFFNAVWERWLPAAAFTPSFVPAGISFQIKLYRFVMKIASLRGAMVFWGGGGCHNSLKGFEKGGFLLLLNFKLYQNGVTVGLPRVFTSGAKEPRPSTYINFPPLWGWGWKFCVYLCIYCHETVIYIC